MERRILLVTISLVAAGVLFAEHDVVFARNTGSAAGPIVIAHRGAPVQRPEHTLASYELAALLGADFIETDLVPTKDGKLVARHENELSATTDVARHPEFAGRHATKTIEGRSVSGWFTEDFTVAELKTLRAVERLPADRPQNTRYDGQFEIPTFQEVLDLRSRLSTELDRELGVYPEIKHPSYFCSLKLELGPKLVSALDGAGLNRAGAPVFVKSYEPRMLKALRGVAKVPLFRITDGSTRLTPAELREIATYAQGIGPTAAQVDAGLVKQAHAAGLKVHPRVTGQENAAEMLRLGVDGILTDQPDTAITARSAAR
ncbi:glycerophosphodiester phosphodiesterase [Pseudonocardiaceae bacterium YIM PH 21723]|nr:glycerophosphodiester phosphodiesterase [Pseudonocardiaceae bacterium YIM PH 21723]